MWMDKHYNIKNRDSDEDEREERDRDRNRDTEGEMDKGAWCKMHYILWP